MKKWNIVLIGGLFFLASITTNASAAEFNFGGQLRLRPEFRDNLDFDKTAADTQNYYGQRVRFNIDGKVNDNTKVFIQIQDARYWGAEGGSTAPGSLYTASEKESLDLHQVYAEIGIPDMPLILKVGRQLLKYGEERLVGDLDWSNNARAFDAIKVNYKGEALNLDIWTSKLTEKSITVAAPSPSSTTTAADDIDFYGIYSTVKAIPFDLYLLYRKDGAAKENRYNLGARIDKKFMDALGLMGEFNYQFGDASSTKTINAYAFAVRAGYSLPAAWSPVVSVEYDYATGDDGSDAKTSKTFNQLYPTWHKYLGYGDYVGWQNISAIRAGFNAKPTEKCFVSLDYWLFSLADKKDGFYNAAGAATGVRAASSSNTKDSIGSELDIIFRHTFNPNLNLEAGYARFFAGDYIKDRVTTDKADDSNWAYLMGTVNF